MWNDNYQSEQQNIQAPEFLKVKTLQKMADARQERKNILKLSPMLRIGFSCIAVVVIALGWINFSSNPELMTELVFERLDGGPRHFGFIGEQQETLTEVESMLGRSRGVAMSDLTLESFHLETTSWAVDENGIRIQYLFERDDVSIHIMLNNYTDSVSTNSILNDIPIALYYRAVLLETSFIAEFLYDETYHQIEAIGLTEEEFVDYLQEIINFLN